ncbi:MAG: type II toxin-antitoxin system VapC family toxin [Promicromonosporaceae bacterium]|nr:type II toxin-antitoxin system VapC family toxin [Promicromonosporaceae bacterium]
MIVVDTNVISEIVRPEPNHQVLEWIRQHQMFLATTAITVQELRFGLEVLPEGRRKRQLAQFVEEALAAVVAIFDYDSPAARATARVLADMQRAGRPLSGPEDAQILGIAKSRGLAVATRNVADFEGWGVDVLDPWQQLP